MPIDTSTWEQATERDSTAIQILDFLRDNESEAYTTNELVAELVPEETDESVVAYYRAVLEALVREGSVEKREVAADAGGPSSLLPYVRERVIGRSDGHGTTTDHAGRPRDSTR